MMAPRKPKSAPAPVVIADPVPELPAMTYLMNPVTVAHQTPRTRDEIAIRDVVRKALADVETSIVEFVSEKTAEGFSLAEIDELYAVELPLLFGHRSENCRIRAYYDAQIVERSA